MKALGLPLMIPPDILGEIIKKAAARSPILELFKKQDAERRWREEYEQFPHIIEPSQKDE